MIDLKNGRFASGYPDNSIIIWDSNSFTPVETLNGHTGAVRTLALLPNGDLASGSDDKIIRVWNMNNFSTKRILRGHKQAVCSLTILKSGLLVSASYDGVMYLWYGKQDTPAEQIAQNRGPMFATAILNEERIALGYFKNNEVRVWNSANLRSEGVLVGHEYPSLPFAVMKNGDLASGYSDKLIHIRDRDTYVLKFVIKGSIDGIQALAALPDGRLASAASNVISIWNTI